MNSLSAIGLVKRYGEKEALGGVSIEVRGGEIVGLLGANGAGKTTSFYVIAGLIKPDRGQVIINGQDVTQMPMHQRARLGLSYLAQDSSIFQGLSVIDNILAVMEICGDRGPTARKAAMVLLEKMGVLYLVDAMPKTLSGGERRRVEITRLLATKPNFLLMDEPFAAIAPITVQDIKDIIRDLAKKGIGVVVTDHNVRAILGLCDRAYILEQGVVLVEGAPEQLAADARARKIYLGSDFTI